MITVLSRVTGGYNDHTTWALCKSYSFSKPSFFTTILRDSGGQINIHMSCKKALIQTCSKSLEQHGISDALAPQQGWKYNCSYKLGSESQEAIRPQAIKDTNALQFQGKSILILQWFTMIYEHLQPFEYCYGHREFYRKQNKQKCLFHRTYASKEAQDHK